MTIDPRERQLLAQLLGVTVVRLDVDRALEEERFVQAVELFMNRFGCPFGSRQFIADGRFPRLPDLQN